MSYYANKTFKGEIRENEKISDCDFVDCVFEDCKFVDCSLENCSFSECVFRSCLIANVKVQEVGMLLAMFKDSALVGVQWRDFQSGIVSFPLQKLENCRLKYNDFEKMSFKKFDFSRSSIIDSAFVDCNLSESDFKDCDLKNTEFVGCDLKKSDSRRAKGYNIAPMSNRIKGAKFSYPDVLGLMKDFEIEIEE